MNLLDVLFTRALLAETIADEIPQPSTLTPRMDEPSGAVGVSAQFALADHVHPRDTTRAAAASVPGAAGIDANGLISFKNNDEETLFTLQLPLYAGGVV